MRKEYDLKALKVKRRGVVPGLRGQTPDKAKVRVTIALDGDIVEHFKEAAAERGALPYQTQINQALRRAIVEPPTQALQSALLRDKDFIWSLAREVESLERGQGPRSAENAGVANQVSRGRRSIKQAKEPSAPDLRGLLEHDTHNARISLDALEDQYTGCQTLIDSFANLLHLLGKEYGANCNYADSTSRIEKWLQHRGGPSNELVEQLVSAELVGTSRDPDDTAEAQRAALSAYRDVASPWLLLRLHRDFLFGLSDLLRLRLTANIGYQRLQAESVGLLILFAEEPRSAWQWFDALDPSDLTFLKRYQPRIKEILRECALDAYYDQGSAWALHSRVFGILKGVIDGAESGPGNVSFRYQELGSRDPKDILVFTALYLRAHILMVRALVSRVPELRDSPAALEEVERVEAEIDALRSYVKANWKPHRS